MLFSNVQVQQLAYTDSVIVCVHIREYVFMYAQTADYIFIENGRQTGQTLYVAELIFTQNGWKLNLRLSLQ